MELDGASKSLAQIRLDERMAGWRAARVGDVLTATVIEASRAGHVVLRINGARVTAQTQQPLAPGQRLTVRVTGLGAQPALEILAADGTAPVLRAPRTIATASIALSGNTAAPVSGQRLQALVVAAGPDGAVTLQTAAGRLTGASTAVHTVGQWLQLESVGGAPRAALAVTAAVDAPELIQSLLRTTLPRQSALPPLLATLAAVARPAGDSAITLPPAIRDAAASVLGALRRPADVASADGLRRALLDSGVFFENKLLAPTAGGVTDGIATDFKAGLMRLIEALLRGSLAAPAPRAHASPTPPLRGAELQAQSRAAAARYASIDELAAALLHQTDGALGRLHVSQLAALPTQEQPQPWLAFELPLRHGDRADVVQLRIAREHGGDQGEAEHAWTIHLAFDLEHLGPVYARVTLQNRRISALFWAERDTTVTLFERHLETLQDTFAGAGLAVGALRCQAGRPPRPADQRAPELLGNIEA